MFIAMPLNFIHPKLTIKSLRQKWWFTQVRRFIEWAPMCLWVNIPLAMDWPRETDPLHANEAPPATVWRVAFFLGLLEL